MTRGTVVKRRRKTAQAESDLDALRRRYNFVWSSLCALLAQQGDTAVVAQSTQALLVTGMQLGHEYLDNGDLKLTLEWPK